MAADVGAGLTHVGEAGSAEQVRNAAADILPGELVPVGPAGDPVMGGRPSRSSSRRWTPSSRVNGSYSGGSHSRLIPGRNGRSSPLTAVRVPVPRLPRPCRLPSDAVCRRWAGSSSAEPSRCRAWSGDRGAAAGRALEAVPPRVGVGVIHPRGRDVAELLARTGLGLRDVDELQNLRTAEAGDLHGSHAREVRAWLGDASAGDSGCCEPITRPASGGL
jgi:hypothetical protein